MFKKHSIKITLLLLFVCLFLVVGFYSPTSEMAIKNKQPNILPVIKPLQAAMEAPAGFDGQTNGLVDQEMFDEAKEFFEEVNKIDDGLGPVFNAESCTTCHTNPVTGGNSQIPELRAGRFDGTRFIEHPGGSLIHLRAIDPTIQEQVIEGNNVRTLRMSPSTLGLGFVEAIDDQTLISIASEQPKMSGGRIAGQVIRVPVVEASGAMRVGRFGFKCSQASLLSFSGDAYLNEMGLTTPLFPTENTSNGRSIAEFDSKTDPELEDNEDIEAFTLFIRATKVPPRDEKLAATPDAQAGSQLFNTLGCAICHVPSITTAPAGTVINGGMFTVPPALGNKVIRPFSDFLLHDIGTGDGIVENGDQSTRNKIRTSPLWGLRTRTQFMHDGLSLTLTDAILRHGGESKTVIKKFRKLPDSQKQQLLTFLKSL
ncbi:MAG: di-heme oxidoredictase family protein [Blastocatellia bacterium]